MRIGSIVKYRDREWIVLPSEDPEVLTLRPIGGTDREKCGVHVKLSQTLGYTLPFERVSEASFLLPHPITPWTTRPSSFSWNQPDSS